MDYYEYLSEEIGMYPDFWGREDVNDAITKLMKRKKLLSEWINRVERSSARYMEAERFILEISNMNFIQRIFCKKKIEKFLNERLERYDF